MDLHTNDHSYLLYMYVYLDGYIHSGITITLMLYIGLTIFIISGFHWNFSVYCEYRMYVYIYLGYIFFTGRVLETWEITNSVAEDIIVKFATR